MQISSKDISSLFVDNDKELEKNRDNRLQKFDSHMLYCTTNRIDDTPGKRRRYFDNIIWRMVCCFVGVTIVVGLTLDLVIPQAHAETTTTKSEKDDRTNKKNFAVAAYLPDYRIHDYLSKYAITATTIPSDDEDKIPFTNNNNSNTMTTATTSILTDLILFSLQPHSRGFLGGCCLQEDHYDLVRSFRKAIGSNDDDNDHEGNGEKRKSPLNVWVTLGGGGRTDAFPEICADEKRRKRLIDSVIKLCAKESIHGVDLDFYQPRSKQERDNYLLFLKEALVAWKKKDDGNTPLRVSMTLHPHQKLPPNLYRYLDRIHLMAYDMISPSVATGQNDLYHASLMKVQRAVEDLLQQPGTGLDRTPQKVLLGIPAYARHTRNPGQVKAFREIYEHIMTKKEEDHGTNVLSSWDDLSTWDGYEWESPNRIREKVQWAQERGLGGIFFWEVGQDVATADHPHGMLLETAVMAITDHGMDEEEEDPVSSSNVDEQPGDGHQRHPEL